MIPIPHNGVGPIHHPMKRHTFIDIVNQFPQSTDNTLQENNLLALCYHAIGSTKTHKLEPLINTTFLLRDAISLFDHVIDNEVGTAYHKLGLQIASQDEATGTVVNVATALLANLGSQLLVIDKTVGCSLGTASEIQHMFYDTLFQISIGQQLSLASYKTNILAKTWESVIAKACPYYELCCWAGARLLTDDIVTLKKIRAFGKAIGILIQIKDDCTDLWGENGQYGDIPSGSMTLPMAYALNVLPAKQAIHLHNLWKCAASSQEAEREALDIVIKSGSLLYLQTEAIRYMQHASDLLTQVAPDSPTRKQLLQLVAEYSTFNML